MKTFNSDSLRFLIKIEEAWHRGYILTLLHTLLLLFHLSNFELNSFQREKIQKSKQVKQSICFLVSIYLESLILAKSRDNKQWITWSKKRGRKKLKITEFNTIHDNRVIITTRILNNIDNGVRTLFVIFAFIVDLGWVLLEFHFN